VLVGWPLAVKTGLLPFLPGDAVKIALAAALLPTAWKVLRLRGR
jgi:biotin transport system substrate-specific component